MLRGNPRVLLAYAFLFLVPFAVFGQEPRIDAPKLTVIRNTPVELQLTKTISSGHVHKNDRLEFLVEKDIEVEGFSVISAGAKAEGSVVRVKGKRPLGMGGNVIINVDSVQLATGEKVPLSARKEFKGRSRTIRMAAGMAISAVIYLPAAPAFLLTPGRESTVLKGTELTAYTKSDFSVDAKDFSAARGTDSNLSEMMGLLPSRVLNGEGREGDMLNLIFAAKEDDLQHAFSQAGWVKVERSTPQIVWHLLWQRKHYTKLPMDRLYVFGRPQDFSYALPDPLSIVARRHHLRIWRTDRMLNGVPLWVGAATHDVAIEFVRRKLRLFHKIDPNVDAERDFIATNLAKTTQIAREQFVRCSEPVFYAQTATGQSYYSDSRMLLLELGQVTPSTAESIQLASKM